MRIYINIFYILFLFTFINAKNIELSSRVISNNQKVISSRYMSYIKKIYVKEGDFVKKNQLLFELDESEIKMQKEQLDLKMQITQNQLQNSKINYQRFKKLYEKNLITKFDYEEKLLKYETLTLQIKLLLSQKKEINQRYKYLKIKAPNDGLIIQKNIQEGEMFYPRKKAFILSDLKDLVIISELTQADLKYVYINKSVDIFITSINFKTEGKIISILPNNKNSKHGFIIKISFSYNKNLYPEMYANVLIKTKE